MSKVSYDVQSRLPSDCTPRQTEESYGLAQQRMRSQFIHALVGNGPCQASSYDQVLQRTRNRRMHALNGNPPKAEKVVVIKAKGKSSKKKSTKGKKERRVRRTAKLAAQQAYIVEEQKNGNAKAQALGVPIRGRGDYELGRNIGGKIGGFIGGKLHEWLSTIFGRGDYKIVSPSAMPTSNSFNIGQDVPSFKTRAGGVECNHRTAFAKVKHTKDFTCTSYPLDMSNSQVFKWSHKITKCFQQWELIGAIVVYVSQSSELTTANAMGNVCISVRYDVDAPPPASMDEALNTAFANSAKPSQNFFTPIECARSQTPLWPLKTRRPGQSVTDNQFYQHGWIDVCTEGAAADYEAAGRLIISFEGMHYKEYLQEFADTGTYHLDLATDDNTRPLKPLADTPLVKQPRVDQIGLQISPDQKWLYFPYTVDPDRVFWVFATVPTGGFANTGFWTVITHKMIVRKMFRDNTIGFINSVGSGTNTGVSNSMACWAVSVDPTASYADPPYLEFTHAATFGTVGLGTLIVQEVAPSAATGLQSTKPATMSRLEFLDYLLEVDAGDKKMEECPVSGRLVDIVEAFTRESYISTVTRARLTDKVYDMPFDEAVARIRELLPPPLRRLPNGEVVYPPSQLSGTHGEWTISDDVVGRAAFKAARLDAMDVAVNTTDIPWAEYNSDVGLAHIEHDRYPENTFVHNGGKWGTVVGSTKTEKCIHPLRRVDMSYRLMRRIQCFMITGKPCHHEIMQCRGHRRLIELTRRAIQRWEAEVRQRMPTESADIARLNGNNGSHTGTDDVFRECKKPCDIPSHYHRIQRQALTGAARRDAEKPRAPDEVKHKPKYLRCPVPTSCPEDDHFHPQATEDMADVEETSERVTKIARDILLQAQQNAELDALGEADAQEAAREMKAEDDADAAADDRDAINALAREGRKRPTEDQAVCQASPSNPQEYAASPATNAPRPVPAALPRPEWAGALWKQMEGERKEQGYSSYGKRPDHPPKRTQEYNQTVPAKAEVLTSSKASQPSLARPQPPRQQASTTAPAASPYLVLPDAPIAGLDINNVPELTTPHHRQQWHVLVHNAGHHRMSEYQKRCDVSTEIKNQREMLRDSEAYRVAVNAYLEKIRAYRDDGTIQQVLLPSIQIGNRLHPTLQAYARVYGLLTDSSTRGNGRQDPLPPVVQEIFCPCGVQLDGRNGCLTACDHWLCAACVCENTATDNCRCPVCGGTEHLDDIHARHATLVREIHVAARGPPPPPPPPDDGPPDSGGMHVDWSDSDLPQAHYFGLPLVIAYRRHQRVERENNLVFAAGDTERRGPANLYYYPDQNVYPRRAYTMSDLLVYRRFRLAPVVARVSSLLVNRVERIANRFAEIGGPIVSYHFEPPRTPRSLGHLAPRAPPFYLRAIGLDNAYPVTIFTNTDIEDKTPILVKAARFCSRIIPFLHPTEEWQMGDDATQASYDTEYVEEGTRSLGYRLAVWRPDHTSTVLSEGRVHTAQSMLSSLFGASRVAYVNKQVVDYLNTSGTQHLKNLHVRAAAFREEGKYTPAQGLINAAMRCLVGEPFYEVLNARAAQVVADSVRYYCQQRFFKSVGDLVTVSVPRPLDFQVGARSAAVRTTGARSGLVESKPSNPLIPSTVD